MGGNALKGLTKRLTREDYAVCEKTIRDLFQEKLGLPTICIPSYKEKEDFGDLDLIVNLDFLRQRQTKEEEVFDFVENFVARHFYSRQQVVNTNILSFEYRKTPKDEMGFQVDLIAFPAEEIKTAVAYYSYNDLGNLIGRVTESMGLKYGHDGLSFRFFLNDDYQTTIVVSRDTDEILSFLGYNPERFKKGFNNLDEIFSYVKSSPYFHKDYYLLEKRNHKSRVRDKKRKTYCEFLKNLESEPDKPKPSLPSLGDIFNKFPEFKTNHDKLLGDILVRNEIRSIFNGERVNNVTGLIHKQLGDFMKFFASSFETPNDMLQHIKNTSNIDDDIMNAFVRFQLLTTKKSVSPS